MSDGTSLASFLLDQSVSKQGLAHNKMIVKATLNSEGTNDIK